MVEWEGQQASSIHIQPQQQVMNATDINQTYGLATSVAEEWLTADITNLQQEAESLCNSVLNTGNIEMNPTSQPGQTMKFSNDDEKFSVSANTFNVPNSNLLDIIISNNFYEQWELDSDTALSSGKTLNQYVESRSPVSLWGSPMDLDNLKMDDVFQVDKADLFQGPTLAELNANDESLFDSLDSFDLLLPSETKSNASTKASKPHTVTLSSSVILPDLHFAERNAKTSCDSFKLTNVKVESQNELEFCENKNDKESFIRNNHLSKNQDSELKLTLNKKLISLPTLIKPESPAELKLQTVPSSFNSANHLVDSASATGTIQESSEIPLKIKQEPEYSRQRNVSESDHACNLSSSLSNDEGFDSQGEISDHEDLYTSDAESGDDTVDEISPSWSLTNDKWIGNKKKKRYFWQYNIQAKGPKGPKLTLSGNSDDPHMMTDVTDPVFSTKCKVEGVKHAGKARRGDGNDLTPNPRKLYNIGLELQKLSSVINELTPVNELPFNARPKSRKEKNKLASRACRLKKKAQHEANKLKFYGLQQEHRHLLSILAEAKKIVKEKIQEDEHSDSDLCQRKIDTLFSKKAVTKVAGYTADFVNNVLDRVAAGDPSGGLSRM